MAPRFSVICFFTIGLVLSMVLCAHAFPHKILRSAGIVPSAPVIISITPANSHVGDTVEIKGTGFDATNSTSNKVFFANQWFVWPDIVLYDSIQAEILAITDTTILAIVPAGATQGVISVSVDGQHATFVSNVSYNVIPTLKSVIPGIGYVGDTIVITGTGFNAWHPTTNYVWFTHGDVSSTIVTSATPTSISVIVPFGTTTGPVTVFTNTPRVISTFDFHILPAITLLSQTSGEVGSTVTLYGTGLDPALASEYHLTFNGTPAVIKAVYSTGIETTVPARATSGPVQLVYNNSVVKGSGTHYSVIPTEPLVSSYTPSSGIIGTPVVINGTGFDQGGPALTVSFAGDVVAEIDSFTNTSIYTKVPLGAQSGAITVTAGGRSSASSAGFRVIENILRMEPQIAKVGDTIVVTGNGFRTFQDYYTLILPHTSIRPISVTSTTLIFVVPPSASYSFVPLITSDYYLGLNIKLPRLTIIPVITSIEPDTVIAGRKMQIEVHGTGIWRQYTNVFEVIFSDSIVQQLTSDNTVTSFVATVPETVASGIVPVKVRLDSMLSLHLNLVVLPDTFPYTPLHPDFFYATEVTTTSITCAWGKSYRALGYILDVTTDNFRTFVPGFESLVVTNTSKLISGLEPGTRYEIRLRPYSDTDTAAYFGYLDIPTIPLPPVAAPAQEVSEAGFICSWSSVKGAESYWIEVSDDSFDTFIGDYIPDTIAVLSIIGNAPVSIQYRVKAVNTSGMSTYSNVITAVLTAVEGEAGQVILYPNPAKDHVFVAGLYDTVTETRLVDTNGKVTTVSLSNMGDNTFSVDIRALPNGSYILQLVVNQEVIHLKFIKQ